MRYRLHIPATLILFFILLINSNTTIAQALPDLIPYVVNGKWGYADTNGKIRIKPRWDAVDFFKDDKARVQIQSTDSSLAVCLIDKKGRYTIGPEVNWNGAFPFINGNNRFNAHSIHGKYGMVDSNGKVIIPLIYDKIPDYGLKEWEYGNQFFYDAIHQKFLSVVKKNGRYGIIDSNGRVIIPFEYDGFFRLYNNGGFPMEYYLIVKDSMIGVIDTNNKLIVPPFYKNIILRGEPSDPHIYLSTKDDRWIVTDMDGKFLFDKPAYSAYQLRDTLVAVTSTKIFKHGLTNISGDMLFPCIYSAVYINGDTIIVSKDSFLIEKFKHFSFYRYYSATTLSSISGWMLNDNRSIQHTEKIEATPIKDNRIPFSISGKLIKSLEKDGISLEFNKNVIGGYWPSGFISLKGKRPGDSSLYVAVIDTNGNYIVSPKKSIALISLVNIKDSLLILGYPKEGYLGERYSVTNYKLETYIATQQYMAINTFRYKDVVYLLVDLMYNWESPRGQHYQLISNDSSKTEQLKDHMIVSYCNEEGITPGYNDEQWYYFQSFNRYLLTKKQGKMGIIDLDGNIFFPGVSYKYEQMKPRGHGIFIVTDEYNGWQYQIANANGKILLDGLKVTHAGRVPIRGKNEIQHLPLFQITYKNDRKRKKWESEYDMFFMNKSGKAYHGKLK